MIFGYLDPGSGSLILQAILGGIAGVAVAWKAWRQKFAMRRQAASGETDASAATVDESPITAES